MHTSIKKPNFLQLLLAINSFFTISQSQQQNSTNFCGKFQIQNPFSDPSSTLSFSSSSSSSSSSFPLQHLILCRSQKLYFRTTLGLFPISSLDYTAKTLTIISSPNSCSSSTNYIPPLLLSAGFPTPPQKNSLLLLNCSNKNYPVDPVSSNFIQNCTHHFNNSCQANSSKSKNQEPEAPYSCFHLRDLYHLDKKFHPKYLNCSHYNWLHKTSMERYELGTSISFDIPGHVPDICNECEKAGGNCGIGLRCLCHPHQCKDKIISGSMKLTGNTFLSVLSFFVMSLVSLEILF